jgi:hypothetical protein
MRPRFLRPTTAVLLLAFVAGCSGSVSPVAPPNGPSLSAVPAGVALPSGRWTSIHWTRVASTAREWGPEPTPETDPNVTDWGWQVFGWSRGYVAFDSITTARDDGSWTMVTGVSSSSDGLHWQSSGTFDAAGSAGEPDEGVTAVIEGSAGLLAIATIRATCGYPGQFSQIVAASADGRTWNLAGSQPGSGSIQTIDAGGAGFIATGEDGVFTSEHATTWTKAVLTGDAFAGLDGFDGGTAFAGGFVFAGDTHGPESVECAAGPTPTNPSLWWSQDGKSWTRGSVTGLASTSEAYFDVCRLNDRVLMANEIDLAGDAANLVWTSTDGRAWTPRTSTIECVYEETMSVGDRALRFHRNDDGTAAISTVADDLSETELAQTGDVPYWASIAGPVFGPAGLITSDSAGSVYVGVPVAG